MSDYNLKSIYEQFRPGDKFSTDFDYDGMLKAGLETGVDTDLQTLKALSDSFEDVNYHRENAHLQNAIEALEDGAIKEASMFFGDFHDEIKATMEEQGMDIEPTVGKFMQNYMKEEEKVKEVTSRESSRIEGDLNIELKAKFLDAFVDLFQSLDDPYFAEDVVDHLSIEMLKHLDQLGIEGDKLNNAGNPSVEFTPGERIGEGESIKEEIGPTGIAITQKQLDDLKRLGAISGLQVYVQDKDGSNVRKVDYTLTNTNFEKDDEDIDFVNESEDTFGHDWLKRHAGLK